MRLETVGATRGSTGPSGGPGPVHEGRVELLVATAMLSGHHERLERLPDGSIPDALFFRPGDGSLFIADAKDTETPGNTRTFQRLSGYMTSLARHDELGLPGLFVLAVAANDAYAWLRVVRSLAAGAGPITWPSTVDFMSEVTAFVWARTTSSSLPG